MPKRNAEYVGVIWKLFPMALLALILSTGCASYAMRPAPIPRSGSMPARVIDQGVEVGADPYLESERQRNVFNEDLKKWRVLPIQLFVKNFEERRRWVRYADITLEFHEEKHVGPVTADTVVAAVAGKIPGFRPGPGAAPPVPGAGIAMLMILGAEAGMYQAEVEAWVARLKDYRSKEFPDVVLGKNDAASGFVFFNIPPDLALGEATLLLRLIEAEDGSHLSIRLRLKELHLKE